MTGRLSKLQQWILKTTLEKGVWIHRPPVEQGEEFIEGTGISRSELVELWVRQNGSSPAFEPSLTRSIANLRSKGLVRTFRDQPYTRLRYQELDGRQPLYFAWFQARWIQLTEKGRTTALLLNATIVGQINNKEELSTDQISSLQIASPVTDTTQPVTCMQEVSQ